MKYTSAFVRRLDKREGRPWQGVLKYKGPDGRQRQATRVFDRSKVRTEAAAKKALAAWRYEMEAGADSAQDAAAPEGRGCTATVWDYCTRYVADMEARRLIEASTVRYYMVSLGSVEARLEGAREREAEAMAV